MDTLDFASCRLLLEVAEDALDQVWVKLRVIQAKVEGNLPACKNLSPAELADYLKKKAPENKAEIDNIMSLMQSVSPTITQSLGDLESILSKYGKKK